MSEEQTQPPTLCTQFKEFLSAILIDKQSYLLVSVNENQQMSFEKKHFSELVERYVVNYIGSVGKDESSKHDDKARQLLKAINNKDSEVDEVNIDKCGRVKKGVVITKKQKEKIKNDLDFELRLREQFLNKHEIFGEKLLEINNEAILLFANLMWLRYLPMSKKKINDNPESFGETAVNKIKNTLQLADIKLANETLFNTNEDCVPYGQATIYIDNEMTDLVLLFNELAKWEITVDNGDFMVSDTTDNHSEQYTINLSAEQKGSGILHLQINQQGEDNAELENDVRLEFYKQFIIRWCLDLPLDKDEYNENEGVRSQAYKKVFEKKERQRKAPAAPLPLHNMLLFICDPEHYDNISVTGDKKKIVETFKGLVKEEEYKTCTFLDSGSFEPKNIAYNKYLYCIYEKIKKMEKSQNVKIYDPEYKNLWSPDIDQLNNLKYKKALILYGPPGTSKTYTAKQLAKAIIFHSNYSTNYSNYKDDFGKGIIEKRIHRLQLHPNYTYEDFIWGYQIENEKYDKDGNIWKSGNKIHCVGSKTTPKKGYFLRLLDEIQKENQKVINEINKLKKQKGKETEISKKEKELKVHVLILDEINRVDLSRLFGELFSAIENRNEPVDLTVKIDDLTSTNVNGLEVSQISVPENLYIIGTMNEIDFSLERVDFALRRRFVWEFYGFNTDSLYSIIEFNPTFTPAKAHFPCWSGCTLQLGGRCDLQIFIFLNGASL